jgi:hypothetical protein
MIEGSGSGSESRRPKTRGSGGSATLILGQKKTIYLKTLKLQENPPNNQHSEHGTALPFSYLCVFFLFLDTDLDSQLGSEPRDLTEYGSNPDPDLKYCPKL